MSFDPLTAKPKETIAYLSNVILKTFGDKVQNASQVNAIAHGSFQVVLHVDNEVHEFNFRRGNTKKIAKAIRALG